MRALFVWSRTLSAADKIGGRVRRGKRKAEFLAVALQQIGGLARE
jgi:hypothetical protein